MNRCLKISPAVLLAMQCSLLALTLAFFPGKSTAQTSGRAFPAKALRATLVVQTPPVVLLDGVADRLSPGARIHDSRNMLAMSGALIGQSLTVNYLRDGAGLIHEVWILTAAEIAEKRPGATTGINFNFGSAADTQKRDDGKTPFNQLPVYPKQ